METSFHQAWIELTTRRVLRFCEIENVFLMHPILSSFSCNLNRTIIDRSSDCDTSLPCYTRPLFWVLPANNKKHTMSAKIELIQCVQIQSCTCMYAKYAKYGSRFIPYKCVLAWEVSWVQFSLEPVHYCPCVSYLVVIMCDWAYICTTFNDHPENQKV